MSPSTSMILCGTDFSTSATNACRVAALLARRLDERLHIVHVVEDLGAELALRRPEDGMYEGERRRLDAASAEARKLGVTVSSEMAPGSVAAVLADRAAQASLVVVGYLGARTPGRWLVGSNAERLARSSPVPLFVVRAPGAICDWLEGQRCLKLMLAVDRSETSHGAARWLALLRRLGPLELAVVHAGGSESETRMLEHAIEHDFGPDLASARIPAESITFHVKARAFDIDAELAAVAEELGAELVIVGSHQRSGVERLWRRSVSRGLLNLAAMSVIVLPVPVALAVEAPVPVIRAVLAATDFSSVGDKALLHALSLLSDGGALHLAHVLSRAAGGTPVTSVLLPPTPKQEIRVAEASALLERAIPREAIRRNIRVETHVLEGDVADALCAAAERIPADVVCLASRTRSAVGAFVLGSVTMQVLARSKRPVLVVRTPVD